MPWHKIFNKRMKDRLFCVNSFENFRFLLSRSPQDCWALQALNWFSPSRQRMRRGSPWRKTQVSLHRGTSMICTHTLVFFHFCPQISSFGQKGSQCFTSFQKFCQQHANLCKEPVKICCVNRFGWGHHHFVGAAACSKIWCVFCVQLPRIVVQM